MTTPNFNLKHQFPLEYNFLTNSAIAFNAGDLMCLDLTNYLARPIASGTDACYLLGEARTSSTQNPNLASINTTLHTVLLTARSAGTFYNGTPVYYNTDAQSFTLTSPGVGAPAIGVIFQNTSDSGMLVSGTTVINQQYEVLLARSFINDLGKTSPMNMLTNYATVAVTTTLAQVSTLTYTPPPGTYLVWFTGAGTVGTPGAGNYVEASISAGGTQIPCSRQQTCDAVNYSTGFCCMGPALVNGSQAIQAMAIVTAGAVSGSLVGAQTLITLKIG